MENLPTESKPTSPEGQAREGLAAVAGSDHGSSRVIHRLQHSEPEWWGGDPPDESLTVDQLLDWVIGQVKLARQNKDKDMERAMICDEKSLRSIINLYNL